MASSYYRLLYRLDGRTAFLIWFSNERDGVLTQNDRILSFSTEESLSKFAAKATIELVDEAPTLHALDVVREWILRPRPETVDCSEALAAWNLFGDVARSLPKACVGFSELDRAHSEIYEKLFFGNNLAAITPAGAHYAPTWSEKEVAALLATLDCGLRLFRALRQDGDGSNPHGGAREPA
ncbi:MAG: hypothetical protein U0441_19735 [Polyangiaceae bacterium]